MIKRSVHAAARAWLLLIGALTACSDGEPTAPPVASSIQIAPAALTLQVGETQQLTATVLDQRGRPMAGQTPLWSSSDTTRITVSEAGLARAVRPGTATVSARAGTSEGVVTADIAALELRVEQNASVTTRLGAAGGLISARGSNGATYTLSVPARALRDTVSITVTPVASLGALDLYGAVRFQPSGLRFSAPVTVTAELPAPPANTADVVGFHFSDDGRTLTRQPVLIAGRTMHFLIDHFSGVGGGGASVAAVITPVVASAIEMQQVIMEAIQTGDLTFIKAGFRGMYQSVVEPALGQAQSDAALTDALVVWRMWKALIPLTGSFAAEVLTFLGPELGEARSLAAAALRAAIARANDICLAQESLLAAITALAWQQEAVADGIDTPEFALDLDHVLRTLCVKVRYADVSLPDTIRPGREATLRAQAGISFGGGPLRFPSGLRLEITTTPSNSTDDMARTATADAIGVVTRQLTPADTLEMRVLIHACLNLFVPICADEEIARTPTNVLYFNPFADSIRSEWSLASATTSPSGQRFLGELSNDNVTLSLTALPAHTALVLEFDLYILASWNGNAELPVAGSPDILEFAVAGDTMLKRTTFSNKPRDNQAYPGDFPGASHPATTGALATNSLGYPPGPDYFGDSVYRVRLVFPHTSGIITLQFNGNHSGQIERWGLDNVRLSLGS